MISTTPLPYVGELAYPWDRWYGDRRELRTSLLVILAEADQPLTAREIAVRLGRPWPALDPAGLLGWLRRRGYVSSPGAGGRYMLWTLTDSGRDLLRQNGWKSSV